MATLYSVMDSSGVRRSVRNPDMALVMDEVDNFNQAAKRLKKLQARIAELQAEQDRRGKRLINLASTEKFTSDQRDEAGKYLAVRTPDFEFKIDNSGSLGAVWAS
jgi:hypothetical protein